MGPLQDQKIEKWLKAQDCAHLTQIFAANRIAHDKVAYLEDSHMKEMGILIGDRLRLLPTIEKMRVMAQRTATEDHLHELKTVKQSFKHYYGGCFHWCDCCIDCFRATKHWKVSGIGFQVETREPCKGAHELDNVDFVQMKDIVLRHPGCYEAICCGAAEIEVTTEQEGALILGQRPAVVEKTYEFLRHQWEHYRAIRAQTNVDLYT
uniref:SAM domain-containing protein n=1 Tax=Chromera velia CCMP2878 TaxID=1169474 RepID=A0A0G4HVJ2_9ALVE|eukprot:Cvel_8873.t1-p1 / transcript=Cvel_8873.t1 / gene=Cvel_8873 / organism=Chromera_velia_CCMP2878 / gene_product=hypothetical protein / transcript_product=hypothetical protein / location=Cvel_scaffold499:27503-28785(+) / protein_length=206 / sequence_SO=supercontig / SO=protein_coding / is_pseudo=false